MAFSGKVSSSPIKRLPSLQPPPPFSFLYFHLYQFWFTSENDPLRPINFNHPPPSLFHRGIIGTNWRAGSLPRRYEIRLLQLAFLRVLDLPVSINKPDAGSSRKKKKTSSTSHETCNWISEFWFSCEEALKPGKTPHVSGADQPVSTFPPSSVFIGTSDLVLSPVGTRSETKYRSDKDSRLICFLSEQQNLSELWGHFFCYLNIYFFKKKILQIISKEKSFKYFLKNH